MSGEERIHMPADGKPCPACGLRCTETIRYGDGRDIPVDPCLGCLPGVIHACCGHGGARWGAYAIIAPEYAPGHNYTEAIENGGRELRGDDALAWFEALGVGPAAAVRARVRSDSSDG